MRFKDIVGQRVLINQLTEVIDAGRVSHAQLMLGKMGYGTLALALGYVQYLMCENRQHYGEGSELRADSCGECPSCKKIASLMHPDVHLYFPSVATTKVDKPCCAEYREDFVKFLLENNMYVSLNEWYAYAGAENKQGEYRAADAMELIEEVARTSYEGREKVFILWMPENIRPQVANELLKTLEEPYAGTLIMLVGENVDRMLETVRSRVQTTRVSRIIDAGLPEEAEGDYMVAQRLKAESEDVEESKRMFVEWMRLLFKLKMAELSKWVENISGAGRERQKVFLGYVLDNMRRCYGQTAGGMAAGLKTGDERFDAMFPSMVTTRNVEQIYESVSEALFSIERNANAKVTFMHLSFQLSRYIKNR
ncbi:MAG: hypothetical protein J5526_03530 [Bacteroidales bacterium]|nr:hypothetical protein [Bacteroidales bacterium]